MPDQILVIDDDPRLVTAIRIRLEASGYVVHGANGGEEGISIAKKLRPQAIVLDVNMAGIDGLQVCRLVRADHDLCATPIIMFSAITHEVAQQAAIQAGANKFLGKPFDATQLLASICGVIETRRDTGGAGKATLKSGSC